MSPAGARAGAGRSTQVRGQAGAEAGPRLGAGGPPPRLCSPRPPAPAPGGEPRVAAAVAEPAQPGAGWQLPGASRTPAQPGRAEETLSRSPALAVPLGRPTPAFGLPRPEPGLVGAVAQRPGRSWGSGSCARGSGRRAQGSPKPGATGREGQESRRCPRLALLRGAQVPSFWESRHVVSQTDHIYQKQFRKKRGHSSNN